MSHGGATDARIINGMGLGDACHLEVPRMFSVWLGGLVALTLGVYRYIVHDNMF